MSIVNRNDQPVNPETQESVDPSPSEGVLSNQEVLDEISESEFEDYFFRAHIDGECYGTQSNTLFIEVMILALHTDNVEQIEEILSDSVHYSENCSTPDRKYIERVVLGNQTPFGREGTVKKLKAQKQRHDYEVVMRNVAEIQAQRAKEQLAEEEAAERLQAEANSKKPRFESTYTPGNPNALIISSPENSPSSHGSNSKSDYSKLTDRDMGIFRASALRERPHDWLWKYRFERGQLSLIVGNPGVGKGQVMAAIGSMVSVGGLFPDGSGYAPIGDVAILSAEENPQKTTMPRLRMLGADMDRIHFLKARYIIKESNNRSLVNFTNFQDIDYWQDVFMRIPDLSLFIVDPLPSYLGEGVNDSSNIEVRGVMEPFIEHVLRPRGVSMIADTHFNKSTVDIRTPLFRVSGSIAYAALARNLHFVLRDLEDPSLRYFLQEKCNDAPEDLPSLTFKLERHEYHNEDDELIETAVPAFSVGALMTSSALMNPHKESNQRGPKPTTRTKVAVWLFDYLSEKKAPVLLAEIFHQAGEAGYAGKLNSNGRWSNPALLYRAMEMIPELPEPRQGYRVLQEPDKPHKHWQLVKNEV